MSQNNNIPSLIQFSKSLGQIINLTERNFNSTGSGHTDIQTKKGNFVSAVQIGLHLKAVITIFINAILIPSPHRGVVITTQGHASSGHDFRIIQFTGITSEGIIPQVEVDCGTIYPISMSPRRIVSISSDIVTDNASFINCRYDFNLLKYIVIVIFVL